MSSTRGRSTTHGDLGRGENAGCEHSDGILFVGDRLKEERDLTGENHLVMLLGRGCISKEGFWICYERKRQWRHRGSAPWPPFKMAADHWPRTAWSLPMRTRQRRPVMLSTSWSKRDLSCWRTALDWCTPLNQACIRITLSRRLREFWRSDRRAFAWLTMAAWDDAEFTPPRFILRRFSFPRRGNMVWMGEGEGESARVRGPQTRK